MVRLGFVGLGVMGGRIVNRLLKAGHSVTGYNRTRSKARWLLDAGMQWRDTPREVAEAADVVFTMVTDTNALHQLFDGPAGILAGLRAGKIYIDMSTISPAASRAFADQVAAKGAHMLDVPVSGSVLTLEQGNLSLMAGGAENIFEQIRPVLLDIGPKVNYVGENGQAVLMKIAINLNLAVQILAFSEGMLLAEKGGIPRATAHKVMLDSAITSPSLRYRTPFILEEPGEAWFNVNMMQKDVLLALEMGRTLDVPLPMTGLSNEFLTAARAMGLAEHDFAVLYKTLARLAGLDT